MFLVNESIKEQSISKLQPLYINSYPLATLQVTPGLCWKNTKLLKCCAENRKLEKLSKIYLDKEEIFSRN